MAIELASYGRRTDLFLNIEVYTFTTPLLLRVLPVFNFKFLYKLPCRGSGRSFSSACLSASKA